MDQNIYYDSKNYHYIFDQIGSELSKMDHTWSNWNSPELKNVDIKSCLNYHEDENGHFIFNQIGSDLSKMDQTWSDWISP